MDTASSWLASVQGAASDAFAGIVNVLPVLFAAILILAAGWVIARIARSLVRRLANGANRMLERIFQRGTLASVRFSSPAAAVLGEVIFWIVLFLAATAAARVAGLDAIAEWLNEIVAQLPNLIVGAVIIGGGYFAGIYAGRLVASTARAEKGEENVLLGRLAQAIVFITALIVGLDQFGVEVTFLVTLLAVAAGALLAGFSLAFGLGARNLVRNLIGARTARHELQAGLSIRVGDIQGEILEITARHIVIDAASGRLLVPARAADDETIAILATDAEQGDG